MIVESGWKPGEADRAPFGKGRNHEGSKWHAATAHPRTRDHRARERRAWKRDAGI